MATRAEADGQVEHSLTYVVEADGAPVGRLRVVRTSAALLIAGLQILPVSQRQGIGSAVMRRLMDEAQRTALPVRLEVEKDNPAAKRLYLWLGLQVLQDRNDRELMEMRFGVEPLPRGDAVNRAPQGMR